MLDIVKREGRASACYYVLKYAVVDLLSILCVGAFRGKRNRRAMLKYLNDISWETEVWVAESPTHLIHFNGERFLGPYED